MRKNIENEKNDWGNGLLIRKCLIVSIQSINNGKITRKNNTKLDSIHEENFEK